MTTPGSAFEKTVTQILKLIVDDLAAIPWVELESFDRGNPSEPS